MLRVVLGWHGLRLLSRMCFAVCPRPPSCSASITGRRCSRLVRLRRATDRCRTGTSEPLGRGREDGLADPAELLPALPGPRGQTEQEVLEEEKSRPVFPAGICVTSGSRDESSGPRLMPLLLIKMLNKSRGKILGVLALFLVMVWYSIYREDRYTQLFYFPVQENKTTCPLGEVEKKASQLIGNYTRDHPLFLQLKDYFWVKTPSLYELPYGTKGSEDVLLRLLSITHYSLPESIQSLKCRRCAVVGNGHRLRNSSMGETINTYDVVIRLNNAPVHGYEQDVGSKTTMRLFYPESAHFNPKTENNPDTLLVLVPFKPMDFQWMEAILNDKKRVRKGFWKQPPLIWDANPEQVRILNPYYMEVTAAKLLNLPMKQPRKVKQKPTTGLLAITLALHFCDLVHIAGFGYPDSANKKQTIHYYEQITLKSMAASEHNVSHEAVAIKRMLELGLVKNLTYF
ncbi:CMP-N-acetylneuraminate-beta-galactosamide-alpha-2,3-sialyltransferase 4 isoform X3 [Falco biarmicus]|uniref:CMP-N-acetylneuraminate-beta-galactosamide- alpha-2,3-sialyltransferase 4 isoform X3 n=1 Tax=Falco cherrug TaxID=345164 RepID=UPI00247B234B|nr:CMP-N-acetylneuraminate-beta-galactosamide-alpha-2,3-sialyltransferase 4 isoform X3 [Falco cherrug]XP_056178785.1 CMP-N-acetylneuraminate-beta-galactosamide-alpha-2,3-sialyltransferase 4 isoform X3 [Falco biarmicus]